MAKSPEEEHPVKAFGWAATDRSGHLSPFKFSRRATGEEDVRLTVLYCGICHSDLYSIKNEWGHSTYPMVPGCAHTQICHVENSLEGPMDSRRDFLHYYRYEIVGVVTEVGSKVTKFKVGDKVGVGCMVGACLSCESCSDDLENYCSKMILTYNMAYHDGTTTYGGYSDIMVASERFVVRIPDNLPLDGAAPLLCAGITVCSPLKYFGFTKPGMHLGIVGLGGLGHVAVKFAKAFGLQVTLISTSPSKKKETIEILGADSFLLSPDPEQMQAARGTLDGIIDTISAIHPIPPLLDLLKPNGKLILLGVLNEPHQLPAPPLIMGRKTVAGSVIGGMKETQEMLDFAAKHNVTADIEVVPMDYVNTAMERLAKGDVRYRFVIDVGNSLSPTNP